MRKKIVAIIQVRMGSSRLPRKALLPLLGEEPVLACVVNRTQRAATLDEVVIATTIEERDEPIVNLCKIREWTYFRGSEEDVLDRYLQAALVSRADVVVRITSDCPLIDPEIIDSHVHRMLSGWHRIDFVTNMMPQTFPLGLAVEVMPMDVLVRMHRLSTTAELREHVTTLAYEKPQWFLVDHVLNDVDLSALRWTVDFPEDLLFVQRVFAHFGSDQFTWREALHAVQQHPEWSEINRQVGRRGPGML